MEIVGCVDSAQRTKPAKVTVTTDGHPMSDKRMKTAGREEAAESAMNAAYMLADEGRVTVVHTENDGSILEAQSADRILTAAGRNAGCMPRSCCHNCGESRRWSGTAH